MPYGQLSTLAISFQDSYGQYTDPSSLENVVADSWHFIQFLDEDLGLEIPPLVDESMRGVFDEGDTYEGPRTIGGTINCNARALSLGTLLTAAFGDPTTQASGSIYNHVFEPATSDFDELCAGKPFTILKYSDTGSAQLFGDMAVSGVTFSVAAGDFMKVGLNVVGGLHGQIATTAATHFTGKRWTWDQTSVSIGGSANSEVMDMEISIDESMEAQHVLNNSKYPGRIKRTGFRTVSISGTLKFDNQTEFQAFLDQDERILDVTFTGPTEIQSGYYDTCRIECQAFRYSEFKPAAGGAGQIEVSFSASGKYDTSSSTAIRVTVINTQASY